MGSNGIFDARRYGFLFITMCGTKEKQVVNPH
jgi:hypothetical protein